MSLIACPECMKQVSDQAGTCPQCGYPINPANSEMLLRRVLKIRLKAGAILCCIGIVVGLFMNLPSVWVLGIVGLCASLYRWNVLFGPIH